MTNLALYREYRPKTFDEVIGQDHIITTLINQIKTSMLSHAYLFCGTRGTGKTSTAKIFAKAVNCENNQNGSPCFKCNTCLNLNNASNLDILEIDAASNNRVDEIRDLRDKVKYPPVNGKYKVYIIDEVHMLTDSAYNALLKTLEEPPAHAIFILCTTEVQKLPKTILSRCMRFDFRLVSCENLEKLLIKVFDSKNIKYEKEALQLIASRGEGCVRDTLSIADLCVSFCNKNLTYLGCLEALGSSSIEELNSITDSIIEDNGEKLLTCLNNIALSGKNFNIFTKELINHFKSLLTIKTINNAQKFLMLPAEIYDKLKTRADALSSEEILSIMTKLSNIETQLKFSFDQRTLVEITLLDILCEKKTKNLEKKTSNISSNIENKTLIANNQKNTLNENSTTYNEEDLNNSVSDNDNAVSSVNDSKLIMTKILKYLRENNCRLLQSIFQDFIDSKISNNMLIITFYGENYKNILEKEENFKLINDIIVTDNLKVKYIYTTETIQEDINDVLKQKFNEINIKE